MPRDESGPNPLSEDSRLTALDARLERARKGEAAGTGGTESGSDRDYRLGNRVLAELVGGMVGGVVVGYTLDRLFGTSPWLLLVLLFLGTASAFRNIYRIATRRPD